MKRSVLTFNASYRYAKDPPASKLREGAVQNPSQRHFCNILNLAGPLAVLAPDAAIPP